MYLLDVDVKVVLGNDADDDVDDSAFLNGRQMREETACCLGIKETNIFCTDCKRPLYI